MNKENPLFDHEKLFAYQRSIEFVAWSSDLLETSPPNYRLRPTGPCLTSVPLNIAEGNGKYTSPTAAVILNRPWLSLECAACLDVLVARKMYRGPGQSGKHCFTSRFSAHRIDQSFSPDRLGRSRAYRRPKESKSKRGWNGEPARVILRAMGCGSVAGRGFSQHAAVGGGNPNGLPSRQTARASPAAGDLPQLGHRIRQACIAFCVKLVQSFFCSETHSPN